MTLRGLVKATIGGLGLAAATFGAAQASDLFQYDRTGPGGGAGGNLLEYFELVYTDDGATQRLSATLDFTSEIVRGGTEGGFWLVVSDGENPKSQIGEYAILYGDLNNNRITAFEYNGNNSADSIVDPGNQLEIFSNAMTYTDANNSDGIVTFDLDVTSINMANLGGDWDGVSFGEKIGVWFHFGANLTPTYANGNAASGQLTNFHLPHQGYVDFANGNSKQCDDLPPDFPGCDPVTVSEPGSVALLGLGLVGLAAYRRRSAA